MSKKYRPVDFDQIIGMDHVKEILKSMLSKNELKRAYLFSGEYSSGKTTIARIFARSVLCLERKPDGTLCGVCASCVSFLADRHPGYLEIDAATHGGIEDINKLKEDLVYESLTTYRIILLDECHMISKSGKDALLLELEKQSDNSIFLFCTTEIDKMPATLRSRCTEFYLASPAEESVVKKLVGICDSEGIPYESLEPFYLLAAATGNHFRDAENKIDQLRLLGGVSRDTVKKVIQVQNEDVSDLLLSIPTDLKKALELCRKVLSRIGVHDLYRNILSILVDSEKRACGLDFGDKKYQEMLDTVHSGFLGSVPNLLEYLLTKDRVNNVTTLEADLILIHHKFLRGNFKVRTVEDPGSRPAAVKPVQKDGPKPFSFSDLDGKNSHEKNTIIREMRKKQAGGGLVSVTTGSDPVSDADEFFKHFEED